MLLVLKGTKNKPWEKKVIINRLIKIIEIKQ